MIDTGNIYRIYYGHVYRATEIITRPVVKAITDVCQDAIQRAVKEGVKDVLNPTELLGEFFRRK